MKLAPKPLIAAGTSLLSRLFSPREQVIVTTSGVYHEKARNGKNVRGALLLIEPMLLSDAAANVHRAILKVDVGDFASAHYYFDCAIPELTGIDDIVRKLQLACRVMRQSYVAIDDFVETANFDRLCQNFERVFGDPLAA
jgi:hypothetical protein